MAITNLGKEGIGKDKEIGDIAFTGLNPPEGDKCGTIWGLKSLFHQ